MIEIETGKLGLHKEAVTFNQNSPIMSGESTSTEKEEENDLK